MLTRLMLLTAFVSSAVAAVVAFGLGLALGGLVLYAPRVEAQGVSPTAGLGTPTAAPGPSATATPAPVLRAQRFELVDATGAVVASLGRQQSVRASEQVAIFPRTALEFTDAEGRLRAGIGLAEHGQPAVWVHINSGWTVPQRRPRSWRQDCRGTPPHTEAIRRT